jgi:hypothetical protein
MTPTPPIEFNAGRVLPAPRGQTVQIWRAFLRRTTGLETATFGLGKRPLASPTDREETAPDMDGLRNAVRKLDQEGPSRRMLPSVV